MMEGTQVSSTAHVADSTAATLGEHGKGRCSSQRSENVRLVFEKPGTVGKPVKARL